MNPVPEQSALGASLQGFCVAVLASDPAVAPYSRNYLQGHARALSRSHPGVEQLAGASTFAALAQVYARHYPADHWDLNLYGGQFADFIAAQLRGGRAAAADWLLLAQLARIEYGICRAYYADERAVGAGEVLTIGPDATLTAHYPTRDLRPLHPYADVSEVLALCRPIAIQRRGLRVQVANGPAVGDGPG